MVRRRLFDCNGDEVTAHDVVHTDSLTADDARRYRVMNDVPEPADPWQDCYCGEPWNPETGCSHGAILCAEHADRCEECRDEQADARADLDLKYAKEQGL